MWMVAQGGTAIVWAAEDTAEAAAVGVSRNAVQQWLRWYQSGGLAAVRSHRRCGPGKPSYLTPEQQAQLVAAAA